MFSRFPRVRRRRGFPAGDPFQGAEGLLGECGDGGNGGAQASRFLPVGKPAALRRVASMDRARPAASSGKRALMTSTGSQRWARAVGTSSRARARAWGIFSCRINAASSAGSAGALVVGVVTGLIGGSFCKVMGVVNGPAPMAAQALVPCVREVLPLAA